MSSGLLKYFRQPYPVSFAWRDVLRSAAISGLVVWLLFYVLRPWNMAQDVQESAYFFWSLLTGASCTVWICLCYGVFPVLLPQVLNEERWTIFKNLLAFLLVCFCIGSSVFLLNHYWFGTWFTFRVFILTQFYSIMAGLLPMFTVILIKQWILLKKYGGEAEEISKSLVLSRSEQKPSDVDHTKQLALIGEKQEESLIFSPADFLYIKAADNYIEVHYLKDQKPLHQLLRLSMKKAENMIGVNDAIFRCHKSYIANLAKVVQVKGNAQGYQLYLEHVADPIPVSRSLNSLVKEKLGHLQGLAIQP